MMFVIRLTVGHNVDGVPSHETRDIAAFAARFFGLKGLTAIPALGLWEGEWEESTRLEIGVDTEAQAAAIVEDVDLFSFGLGQWQILAETASGARLIDRRAPESKEERARLKDAGLEVA